MQRRAEETQHHLLVDELERLSADRGLGWTLSPDFKARYLRGAGELELVRSGLDDTMRTAYQAMREVWITPRRRDRPAHRRLPRLDRPRRRQLSRQGALTPPPRGDAARPPLDCNSGDLAATAAGRPHCCRISVEFPRYPHVWGAPR